MGSVYGGNVDPFYYINDGSHVEYRKLDDRVQVSSKLIKDERTAIFIVAGQSNGANQVSGAGNIYTPTKAKAENLFFGNGAIYQAKDPMLGCDNNGGSWMSRLGDLLINGGLYDRVIFVPIAVSGSSVSSWIPNATNAEYLLVAYRRVAALGLTVTAVLWQQGEADNANGMTRVNYAAHMTNVINGLRADGCDAPWMLAKSTWYLGAPSTAVQLAVDDVIAAMTDVYPGANTDSLNNTYRPVDQTHLLANGADANAALWYDQLVIRDFPGMLLETD